jgi:cell division septal protein FtsQ
MADARNGHEDELQKSVKEMPQAAPQDPGFRRMATWLLLAFVFVAVVSLIAVTLVIHYFDKA